MEYQAFDIATYFVECTLDYLVNSHPFFKGMETNVYIHLCSVLLSKVFLLHSSEQL